MLKAGIAIYLGIGLIYGIFNVLKNHAPFKTIGFNLLFGPVILFMVLKGAITKERINIGK